MKYQRVKRLQGFFTRRMYTYYKENGMNYSPGIVPSMVEL